MKASGRPGTLLRRRAVLALAVSAIGWADPVSAQPADLVDLTVVDRDTGRSLQVWRRNGRLYVAGRPGARYSLRVTNNTGGRVLVVMSVDGVNVLTGQTAGYDQRGYVFSPYETYDVSGWRKSDMEVAAFNFAPQSRSYAARTGRRVDVGVIGVAAFTERVVAPVAVAPAYAPQRPRGEDARAHIDELVVTGQARSSPTSPEGRASHRRAPSDAAASIALAPQTERLGTGHGAREWSAVTLVPFERATRLPQLVRRVEYDSYENLVAAGVIRPSAYPHRPQPFPSGGGYAPDPPGRP